MGVIIRRRRSLVAVLGASLVLMTVIAPVGAATPQQDVHIVAYMTKDGSPGTFVASGAAADSGLVCERGTVVGVKGFNVGWQSGRKVQAISTVELICADRSGSFFISRQIHVVFGGDEPFDWVVLGGTGDYAGLAGRGSGVTADNTPTSNTNIYDGFLLP